MHMAVAEGSLVSVLRAGHIPKAVAYCRLSNANASVYRRLRPSAALAEYVRAYYYRESRAEPAALIAVRGACLVNRRRAWFSGYEKGHALSQKNDLCGGPVT
jgi:hypothetical protein